VRYVHVSLMKMNGIPIGYSEESLATAVDGGQLGQDISSMLVARSQTDLAAQDSYDVTHADKEGRILEETRAEAENGELSMKLVTKREKSKTYSYKGTFRSKDVDGRFEAKDDLLIGFVHQKKFGELVSKGKAAAVSYEKYSPSANLEGTTTV